MLRTQWTICDGADLYDESLELPSMIALRQSMRKRCRDFALHLPQESVSPIVYTRYTYAYSVYMLYVRV
jgi:hypothetical protein